MIFDAIIGVLAGFLTFIGDLIPDVTIPDWFSTFPEFIEPAWDVINGLDNWLPVQAIGIAVAWMIGLQVVIIGIRVTRVVVSLFTGGGGSAA